MKFTIPAFSQNLNFKKALPSGEASLIQISGITQDANGVMWFSTKRGLYKYDSNSFEAYKNNPVDPNSIASNVLETIYAESTGIIWVGSLGNGLSRFDPETGVFTHYKHNPDDKNSLSSDIVTAILRDNDGNLWIGTHGGLDLFDPKTNSFIHYRHDPNNPHSLSHNQIRVIYEDSKNTLWVGTGSPNRGDGDGPDAGGLNRMDKNNNTFTRFIHDPKNIKSLISNQISAVFEDNEGILWVGTHKYGLHKMNSSEGTFERLVYNPEEPDRFSAPEFTEQTPEYERITFIAQDIKNNFWFGTIFAGLYFYNPDSGKVVKYSRSENYNSGFDGNGAWTTFTSKDGIFWIGGTDGSIYYINPFHQDIPHFNLGDKPAAAFFEEPDSTFWIGSDEEVYRNIGNEKSARKYVIETGVFETDVNYINSIDEDKQNNIWIGSTGGLSLWDNNSETFIHYTHDPENNRSLSANIVLRVYEDRKENLWIGTSNGLNLFDRETGLVTRYYPSGSGDNNRTIITSVTEDHTGKLWVGLRNLGGVNLFNPEKAEFKTYLKGSNISCVYEDTDNILWAAGMDGLYRFDRNDDIFINTRHLHHMLDVASVFGIVEDDGKNLWLSTSTGIVKINSQRDEISVYDENYGVDGNTLIYLASYKGRDGKIYFGNANGYYAFYPDEFINNFNAPDIVFTGFNITNRLVKEGDEGPLQGSLSNVKEIQLQYDENVFSFDFMQIDYAHPEKNQMFCYLENYDNDWRQIISNKRTHYFNVPPGEYIFRVKAVNGYGVWAEKQIAMTIMPPWWKQWWAYVMYGLIFTAGVFVFDRLMRRRIIQRERQKAQQKELEQAKEIEKAYQNLEVAHENLKSTQTQLIHSEKMASLGELTAGIAHEIQNPLNFVNNFSEVNNELLDDLKEAIDSNDQAEIEAILKDLKENESKVSNHGKRAESIVKGMLLHSRGSSGKKEPTDINALCDEYLRLAYHGFRAKDKSFNANYKTEFDPNLPKINMVPQDIGRVLLNLINNAFYAVDTKAKENIVGYKPEIVVSTKQQNGNIEIKVADNGNGIPENIKEKIFQPFFTTKPTGQGTGLGLSLSYDIVKAHGGEIKVESKNNESLPHGETGTEFIIQLPVN